MNCTSFLLAVLIAAAPQATGTVLDPPKNGGVYVIAHRGAHVSIPENTLAAYRKALELGADFIEIDLRATRDGRLVSMHNQEVDDYTGDAQGRVSNFTLEELRALDIGSRVGPEWASERVPTLEEILELCRGKIGLYLDLKQAPVEQAVSLLRQYEMEKKTVWYAGAGPLRSLRTVCPECLPMPDPGTERNLARILDTLSPAVVASSWGQVTEAFVRRCHEAGVLVFVDDDGPETWETLFSWGVDGIQTDHVPELIKAVRARAAQNGPGNAPPPEKPAP